VKVRVVEKDLEKNGWTLVRQVGSHRQYRHPTSTFVITVSGKLNDEMTPGQLSDIRRKTGLELR
jgi:predicted RNA binding protein YcfA (HicA-like mRNA interferase family)